MNLRKVLVRAVSGMKLVRGHMNGALLLMREEGQPNAPVMGWADRVPILVG